MFPFLFRIGPIFIAQIVFVAIGTSQLLIGKLLPCYGYTFIELALQLFLIQMIIAFRLIKKNKQLRVSYISKLVFENKKYFMQRIFWNTFCIGSVIIGLCFWMVKEGLTLTNTELRDSQKIYTLYPLCYFSEFTNRPESGQQFGMIMTFLYSCNVIMNLLLISLNVRSLYVYIQKIKRNRKFFFKNPSSQLLESLIDCSIVSNSILESSQNGKSQEIMQCGICLRKFCEQKVLRLRCSHYFHEQCILLWLQRKDSCPYRCI